MIKYGREDIRRLKIEAKRRISNINRYKDWTSQTDAVKKFKTAMKKMKHVLLFYYHPLCYNFWILTHLSLQGSIWIIKNYHLKCCWAEKNLLYLPSALQAFNTVRMHNADMWWGKNIFILSIMRTNRPRTPPSPYPFYSSKLVWASKITEQNKTPEK